jgi:3-deoxy-alpha-D-manno-octulosonate 8-oxidase|tara:strand:- start:34396 stop:35520 length:1125 start_codon:yes stop_codon:yes gene_type:complete
VNSSDKVPEILRTGIGNARNVSRYMFGDGTLNKLESLLREQKSSEDQYVIYYIDDYFSNKSKIVSKLSISRNDELVFVSTLREPTTNYIDNLVNDLLEKNKNKPCALVGMGGGITLDVTKAVSNLLTNGGQAHQYQGWDLVKVPGIYKIGIPTLSGTGAEATRTCVMTNKSNGLKLGMNSDYTVYDQLILDPELTITVPRNQYFYTGMDAYIHCIEALSGNYRNAIGDSFSEEAVRLCREVFLSDDMMSDESRRKMMVASYLGGCAIAMSYVGVVHPFSAALSVVFEMHHTVANCVTMRAMQDFYPQYYQEFWKMAEYQSVDVPIGIGASLSDETHNKLYEAMIIHEKPLTNALGQGFRSILDRNRARLIFERM